MEELRFQDAGSEVLEFNSAEDGVRGLDFVECKWLNCD
jgi:hypothetical protein